MPHQGYSMRNAWTCSLSHCLNTEEEKIKWLASDRLGCILKWKPLWNYRQASLWKGLISVYCAPGVQHDAGPQHCILHNVVSTIHVSMLCCISVSLYCMSSQPCSMHAINFTGLLVVIKVNFKYSEGLMSITLEQKYGLGSWISEVTPTIGKRFVTVCSLISDMIGMDIVNHVK